jgi:transposase-like protein
MLRGVAIVEPVVFPTCQSIGIVKHLFSEEGKPRYKCLNLDCKRCNFILNYSCQGRLPEVKQQIIEMTLNSSRIRDTAHVLSKLASIFLL